MITPDLLFSYWLFLWDLLYLIGVISYSPKIWFIIAIMVMIVAIFYMLYFETPFKHIFFFLCALFIFKMIPLYIIRKDKYKWKDFMFGFTLFIVYLLWLQYKNVSIFKIYSYTSLKDMPFAHFLNSLK